MKDNQSLPDTIPLEEAINLTSAWRSTSNARMPDGQTLRGFFIPKEDIKALADYAHTRRDLQGFRAYLGFRPGNDFDRGEYKMVLVPIDHDGHDVLTSPELQESMIFDFTRPCPSQCDEESPLYFSP